jgi:hypothetical protein
VLGRLICLCRLSVLLDDQSIYVQMEVGPGERLTESNDPNVQIAYAACYASRFFIRTREHPDGFAYLRVRRAQCRLLSERRS